MADRRSQPLAPHRNNNKANYPQTGLDLGEPWSVVRGHHSREAQSPGMATQKGTGSICLCHLLQPFLTWTPAARAAQSHSGCIRWNQNHQALPLPPGVGGTALPTKLTTPPHRPGVCCNLWHVRPLDQAATAAVCASVCPPSPTPVHPPGSAPVCPQTGPHAPLDVDLDLEPL